MSRQMHQCECVEKSEKLKPAKRSPIVNFGAGPAKLPETVMHRAQLEFREYRHTGIGVLEMSHRSKEFTEIMDTTKKLFRELLQVPNEYDILMMQGGGTGQFAAVPLNLISRSPTQTADYIVTGDWSLKALKEAQRMFNAKAVITPQLPHFCTIAPRPVWKLSDDAAYVYYCANETIHGVEFHTPPDVGDVPLVADMSSNILSRPLNVRDYGVLFAGTQKNIGAAGLTVAIARHDLIQDPSPFCPSVLSYKQMSTASSVFNTPPVYSIYLTKLVLEWIRDEGGLEEMERRSHVKSQMIYDVIEDSDGFYHCPIEPTCRSRMNVPFRIGGHEGDHDLEGEFLKGALERHMISLKGHRNVGGMRASLYNAVSIDETQKLADYMLEFAEKNALIDSE